MNTTTKPEVKELSYAEKIDYYAHLNDIISINNGNSKTGRGCWTISMPAGLTCRPDAPCAKWCYAKKGRQMFPNVAGAYYRNYRIWQDNPKTYEDQLDAFLRFFGAKMLRINDCGDIPDMEYLEMLCRVLKDNPQVKALAYTKKFELVNEFLDNGGEIPDNFTIRFSAWDKNFEVPNPYNLPVAYVDFKAKDYNPDIPDDAFECRGGEEVTCSVCQVCWKKKVQSVVFHQH